MSSTIMAALFGFVAGPIGAMAAVLLGTKVLRTVGDSVRGAMLAFSGGFIVAVAFLGLITRGLGQEVKLLSTFYTLSGFALGALVREAVTRVVVHRGAGEGKEGELEARQIAISLAVVNLLEGFPIGIGFAVSRSLGLLIGAMMVFENFTEALSVNTELSRERSQSLTRRILLSVLPTGTLGIGAMAGVLLGGLFPSLMAGMLGAGAGVMIYAVIHNIVYDAHKLGPGAVSTWPFLFGIALGVVFIQLK